MHSSRLPWGEKGQSLETYHQRKQTVYREYVKSYDDDRRLMVSEQALTARIAFVTGALSDVRAVLDLGCGTGDLLRALAPLLPEQACGVGVDLSPEMLAIARQKTADCPHVYVIQADVTQLLPFPDDAFDLVASLNLLQEVPDPVSVLEEVRRVLKPGGRFRGVAACYAGNNPAEMAHQAVAQRQTWSFLPADEMLPLFQRVFPTGTGRFESLPRVARTQAAGQPSFRLFTDVMRAIQELGHDPQEVRMGPLFLAGEKERKEVSQA